MSKFIITSTYGELLDLAMHLKFVEKCEVLMHITSFDYRCIGDEIIEKCNDWWRYIGKGYTWVFDGCEHAERQDWLREQGEAVFGTSHKAAQLEDVRQLGQQLFEKMGLLQPKSVTFEGPSAFDQAIEYVKAHSSQE